MRGVKTLTRALFAIGVVLGLVMSTSQLAAAQETDLVALTNLERTNQGLHSLKQSDALMRSAKLKAEHMLANNYWSHNAPDGTDPWHFINHVDYDYKLAGENLAKGFSSDDSAIKGLMNSELHKKNILESAFTEVGVAEVTGELQGKTTTLIVFHYASPKVADKDSSMFEAKGFMASVASLMGRIARLPEYYAPL